MTTKAIEEIPGPEPITYERCTRCGNDVPRSTTRHQCADCRYTEKMGNAAQLRDQGIPDARIAGIVGLHQRTIVRALGPRRQWRSEE